MSTIQKNTDRTERIVQAATQLFARQGYHGTSTREIARLAGTSENTLFRHFQHKEDIFWSALRNCLAELQFRKDVLDGIAAEQTLEVILPKIFTTLVDTVKFRPHVICLLGVALIEMRWKAEGICQEYFSPIFTAFNRYLAANIENGRIRNVDPLIVTSALTMTVVAHSSVSAFIAGAPRPPWDVRESTRAYTQFWLDMLCPVTANGVRSMRTEFQPMMRSEE